MANVLVGHRVVLSRHVNVGEATSFEVEPGQLIQLIDMAGHQVVSMLAWRDDGERLSPTTTMTVNASIVLKENDKLYGNRRTEMFELVDDMVGRHDLLTGTLPAPEPTSSSQTILPTNREMLESATTNHEGQAPDASSAINFFKHVVIKTNGELDVKEAFSERNDMIVLRALTPATVVVGNAYHERRPGVTAGKQAAEAQGQVLIRVYR